MYTLIEGENDVRGIAIANSKKRQLLMRPEMWYTSEIRQTAAKRKQTDKRKQEKSWILSQQHKHNQIRNGVIIQHDTAKTQHKTIRNESNPSQWTHDLHKTKCQMKIVNSLNVYHFFLCFLFFQVFFCCCCCCCRLLLLPVCRLALEDRITNFYWVSNTP